MKQNKSYVLVVVITYLPKMLAVMIPVQLVSHSSGKQHLYASSSETVKRPNLLISIALLPLCVQFIGLVASLQVLPLGSSTPPVPIAS